MPQAPDEPDDVRDRDGAAQPVVDDLAVPAERIETPFRGRAAAKVQPNQGRLLDDSVDIVTASRVSDPDPYGYPPDRSRTPIMVGAIIAGLIAVAVFAIIRLSSVDRCPAAGCAGQPIRSTVPADAGAKPTIDSSANAGTPTAIGPSAAAPLTAVMPADVDLTTCRTTDDDPFLDNVTAYYACKAGAQAAVPYLQVWGYQFGDRPSYRRGVDAFNAFVKLDPASAETTCPPAATYGSVSWHSTTAPDTDAGVLECYSDSSENHYYVWTDDTEYTILVAESSPEQTFAALDAWWRQNNRNA